MGGHRIKGIQQPHGAIADLTPNAIRFSWYPSRREIQHGRIFLLLGSNNSSLSIPKAELVSVAIRGRVSLELELPRDSSQVRQSGLLGLGIIRSPYKATGGKINVYRRGLAPTRLPNKIFFKKEVVAFESREIFPIAELLRYRFPWPGRRPWSWTWQS